MVRFAPNVFVTRYLEASGQITPEVMAKADHLMTTGYQRQLRFRRNDGSFSAFGNSDREGSLWLTTFVLKSFAQADGLIYIDEQVMNDARTWVRNRQQNNGSFAPQGFVHNRNLVGGTSGDTVLTASVTIALLESGERNFQALSFLEQQLEEITDPYAMAITAYALALGDSYRSGDAHARLLEMATADGEVMYWRNGHLETTAYGTLALLAMGDAFNASRAARWLAEQRNPYGGFGSTQDTVVGLQALIEFATTTSYGADMVVELSAGDWFHEVLIHQGNADVVQFVEAPAASDLEITARGSGQVLAQLVSRFNVPEAKASELEMFRIDVEYGADHVAVDDMIDITAEFVFTPPDQRLDAGMIVLDVSVPTGFAAVAPSLQALLDRTPQIKRYDLAGRKVIFYIEDLPAGQALHLPFQARAQYPVRSQPATAQVYSYYNPGWRGEALGASVTVTES